mmetsp:Transcript_19237/g.47130  ORF Transcript_19237/g.47130 Transcript_19237/m.47130 type:complete len:100 (-) Transcript_19237:313-612(-)
MSRVEHGYGKPSGGRGGRGGGRGGRRPAKFNKHTTGLKFVKKVPKFLQKMIQPTAKEQRENAMQDALKRQFRDLQDDEMPVITNLAEFAHDEEKNQRDA